MKMIDNQYPPHTHSAASLGGATPGATSTSPPHAETALRPSPPPAVPA